MTQEKRILIGIRLKPDLIRRMRIEAVRTGQSVPSVVANALEAALPKNLRIVIGKDSMPERRRA